MPDGDRIPIGIYGRWRKVFRSLDARDPVDRLADDVAGALASDVRRAGGLVGLGRLGSSIQPPVAKHATPAATPPTAPGADRPSDEFTQAVALALNDHLALTSSPEASYALAEHLVKRLAWSRFEKMIHRLIGDQKYGAVELYQKFREILSDKAIGDLVRRVMKHPTGEGLRAPNRRGSRLSAKDLLTTDLGSL
ncbi:hypothetical protein [Asanoa siamensis]|uniref:Uncharacterized protein n=1 Tax=Asanoa siamensis TaxID=926357 RepID=A0ABQ4D3K2_9ACTN|nr:hypothetical protein [Asanoa siamensis]GIF78121.1 hypothetical protein Asi02nite_76390 [Asanoa siamensis]